MELNFILFGVVGIILGVVFGNYISKRLESKTKKGGSFFSGASPDAMQEVREESKDALTERTEERKERILDMMRRMEDVRDGLVECNPEMKDGISRADVESLLGVSDDTARKYLNELESENRIKQIGDSGRGVYYVLST